MGTNGMNLLVIIHYQHGLPLSSGTKANRRRGRMNEYYYLTLRCEFFKETGKVAAPEDSEDFAIEYVWWLEDRLSKSQVTNGL
jgi:hypothetical protein